MRKQTAEEKEVTQKQIVTTEKSAICNKCGKTYKQDLDSEYFEDREDGLWDAEIHSFGVNFGYGSIHDTECWGFDLCDDCLVEIIKTFKHVPDGFYEDPGYLILKDNKEHQKVFDNWKETGQWEELKYKTYDELVNDLGIYKSDYLNEMINKYHPGKPLVDKSELERYEELLGIEQKNEDDGVKEVSDDIQRMYE